MAINQTVYEVEIYGTFNPLIIKEAFNSANVRYPFVDFSLEGIIDIWSINTTSQFDSHVVSRTPRFKENNITIVLDDLAITHSLTNFMLACEIPYTMKSYSMNLLYVGIIKHCPEYYSEYDQVGYYLNRSSAEVWLATDGITDGYDEAEAYIEIKELH